MTGPRVKFRAGKGPFSKSFYSYEGKQTLLVGRARDCAIRTSSHTVSRYHCLIEIADSTVIVRDFGSVNGTYLNGRKIGGLPEGAGPRGGDRAKGAEFTLKPSDILGLGEYCSLILEEMDAREIAEGEASIPQARCNICGGPLK